MDLLNFLRRNEKIVRLVAVSKTVVVNSLGHFVNGIILILEGSTQNLATILLM
jgi:hypothetical protein